MSPLGLAIGFDAEAADANEETEQDSDAVTTKTCAAPTTIAGKYRLERLIGEGGMGSV